MNIEEAIEKLGIDPNDFCEEEGQTCFGEVFGKIGIWEDDCLWTLCPDGDELIQLHGYWTTHNTWGSCAYALLLAARAEAAS